jgi:hypothetical protein
VSTTTPRDPPRMVRGGLVPAAQWNALREVVLQVLREFPGFKHRLQRGHGVVRMRFKSVQADHIVCRFWDGTTESDTDVLVARQPQLRNSLTSEGPFTYTYTTFTEREADDGVDTETQVVVPEYIVDQEVRVWLVSGNPGVTVAGAPDEDLIFEEATTRMWAKKAGT